MYWLCLANPVASIHCLQIHLRILYSRNRKLVAVKTLIHFSAAQFKTSDKDYPVTVVQDACIGSSKINTEPTCPSTEKKNASIAV